MAKRQRFPPEAKTQPDLAQATAPRASGPAPKSKRLRAEDPTLPPPKGKASKAPSPPRTSGIESKKGRRNDKPHASVDEVVADMSRDPRREKE